MSATRTTLLTLAIIIANLTFAQKMALMSELALNETSTVSSNQTQAMPTRGEINGHEYVDLGLSVKWATCNVGVSSPSDYGDYFAWGETSTKSEYTENNSVTYKKSMGDIAGDSQYDAARTNWGGSWRMPTYDEINELLKDCKWNWMTQNGINGYKVTGPNGNSIFLPAAGGYEESSLEYQGKYGHYWSSTKPNDEDANSIILVFGRENDDEAYLMTWGVRYGGESVRAVSP
ncbi:MAG: hypothetical protein LUC88_09125 [Prevotella sp.]|nr:hypothetical protein [Prevotella sp.]